MMAVVTDQPLRCAMIGEADRAVRTGRNVATMAALQERRIATAIEQQNTLFASRQAFADRRLQWRAARHFEHRRGSLGTWRRGFPGAVALIDDLHGRQAPATDPFGKREERELARLCVRPALEAGRRAAEHDDRALGARAHDGDFARMIPRALALPVAS